MLKYSEYKKIQDLKSQGVNQFNVVKRTGYTMYAVRQVWNWTEEEFLDAGKWTHDQFDEFKEDIVGWLSGAPTVKNNTILDRLKEKYPDKELSRSSFYRYMVKLREREGFLKNGVRLYAAREDPKPGEEAQADMGQIKLKDMYGAMVKVYFFCMVLSYSRMKFVYFSVEPFDTNKFIYAHEKAFKYFGGRPEVIMYDQDRILVVSENAGSVIYTKAFDAYKDAAGFKVWLCRPSDPDSKGRIEKVRSCQKFLFRRACLCGHRQFEQRGAGVAGQNGQRYGSCGD